MMKALALAGTAALALLTASAVANAGTITFTWTDASDGYGSTQDTVDQSGLFAITDTFTLPSTGRDWKVGVGVNVATTATLSHETLAIYKVGSATPLGFDPFTVIELPGGFKYIYGSVSATDLGSGDYYTVFSGRTTAGFASGTSVSVSSTVPEASTWAMLGLGFAGIGFLGVTRRKDSRYAI